MTIAPDHSTRIRESVLRDPCYPVSQIADRLLPYLQVLDEQFSPAQVVLFGSYAYGEPDKHSDIDLLIVKSLKTSPLKEKIAIRNAWWEAPRSDALLAFDLIVISPEQHEARIKAGRGFYDSVVQNGLRLI